MARDGEAAKEIIEELKQDRPEARVALHTRVDLVPRIAQRASQRHPYEVPCVVAMPIIGGNPTYVRWVLDETSQADDNPPA